MVLTSPSHAFPLGASLRSRGSTLAIVISAAVPACLTHSFAGTRSFNTTFVHSECHVWCQTGEASLVCSSAAREERERLKKKGQAKSSKVEEA